MFSKIFKIIDDIRPYRPKNWKKSLFCSKKMQVSSPSNKLEKHIRLKVKKETRLYQVFLTRTKFQSGTNISNGTFTLHHQVILP